LERDLTASERGEIAVRLELQVGDDAEETAAATSRLQRRVEQLDAARVSRVEGGPAPEGARSGDLVEIGQLLVQIAQGAAALTTLVGAVQGWLAARNRAGSVTVSIDGDSVELSGELSPTQERVVEAWLTRHERAS
jgi:hypothetical protein